MPPRGKHWCFTVQCSSNEHREQVLLLLQQLAGEETVHYLVAGRETAPTTGSLHLQCFVSFAERKRFATVRDLLPQCHLQCARGSPRQNRTYCTKDGDFVEYGEVPSGQGERTDWGRLRDWLSSLDEAPRSGDYIDQFPALFARYPERCRYFADILCPRVAIRSGELMAWQDSLLATLDGDADDRGISFVVDPTGGRGKSWFCGYLLSQRDGVQLLGPGKRDDLAHVVDRETKIFLLDRKSVV